ncbi:MAG: hypothetical protein AAGF67_17925 [Verrucomicrobiota bacterium]
MEDASHPLSDELLRERFGDLSNEELDSLRRTLSDLDYDPETEGEVDRVLRRAAAVVSEEAPPLPASVREAFETARLDAENSSSEPSVYETPKRYQSEKKDKVVPMSRWHSSVVITGGLAAAAAIVIAFVTFIRPVSQPISFTFADAVTLLTPGEQTGFLEPIFTWKAENSGVVDVTVRTESGEAIASLDKAFSPLRWSALEASASLSADEVYELELSNGEGVIALREFRTASVAEGAPTPEPSLEEIIVQCEELIADNRPADAWMLWGELTVTQKADPRMQELKEQILAVIAG